MTQRLTRALLTWYLENRILYPWRRTRDPYRIWLSEILLQQTRIPVAIEFYRKILKQYPELTQLVKAKEEEFLSLWSGIGYYKRGRNMLACAREISLQHNGIFPSEMHSLLRLPGIGAYTAGAIRNLCFGELTPAIDGNIKRVLARISNNSKPEQLKTFRQSLERTFLILGREAPAADYFQSLMELGERICLPHPRCFECPVRTFCQAYRNKSVNRIPSGRKRREPERFHWYFLLLQRRNSLYYMQNHKRPFLKNTWIYPDILSKSKLGWKEIRREYRRNAEIDVTAVEQTEMIRHSVTFRRICAHILSGRKFRILKPAGRWLTRAELKSYPTSSIVYKILRGLGQES